MARALNWSALSELSPLLGALPVQARAATHLVRVGRDALLFRRGDRPKAMYCVLKGEVRLVRRSEVGGIVVLQRSRKGFIAEASLHSSYYHCDATASEPSEVLAISRAAFIKALADEEFRSCWIAHLAGELHRVRAHAERLSLRTARERIIHSIETEGEAGVLVLTQTKKDWAGTLGLTHEALYRTLALMVNSGELRTDRLTVTLTGR